MGKRGGRQKRPALTFGHQGSITLREESTGKKPTKGGRFPQREVYFETATLAVWASGEASVPSLGAFFGNRLASCGEAMGIPPDPTLIPCQRCESILRPGHNCTIRIEKRSKARRLKKPTISTQNNVVYTCHFCSHRNIKRGTPKGHMKEICPPKPKPSMPLKPTNSMHHKPSISENGAVSKDEAASAALVDEISIMENSPATPSGRTGVTLLESKRRKRNRSGNTKAGGDSAPLEVEKVVSKRRRNSWASFKEIVEISEHNKSRNANNLAFSFSILMGNLVQMFRI